MQDGGIRIGAPVLRPALRGRGSGRGVSNWLVPGLGDKVGYGAPVRGVEAVVGPVVPAPVVIAHTWFALGAWHQGHTPWVGQVGEGWAGRC